jgi:radical SAM superfamily enzyme YgiQ (UPF0313 family)
MKKVATVELQSYERMIPLLGGYLEAFAAKDPWLKASYTFEKHSTTPRVNAQKLLRELVHAQADVYAFSCYVWNTGVVVRLLQDLVAARPSARFMLGGPQVMHRAQRYLKPEYENVAICDGEGEPTFAEYLRQLTEPSPDLSKVPGISFRAGGEIVSTGSRDRIKTLDDIPSPFLADLFKGDYSTTVIETNRGCPFHCAFCYWGAATNDRVHRFSEERIKDEITWIARNGIPFLYIADANWGMLGRDLEFSRHIASCKQTYEAPTMVYYAAAKNKPDNVTEVNRIFRTADIITSQPISLQTLDEETLHLIERQNIKASAFMQIQDRLTALKISSYTELIWPLPGETVDSFRSGIAQLCRMGSTTIVVYPHLLLANTPMEKRKEELGLTVSKVNDGYGEAEVVTATSKVSHDGFDAGIRYFYSVFLLHNIRGLHKVAAYLDRNGITSYEAFFVQFVDFWSNVKNSAIVDFIEESIRTSGFYDVFNYGKLIHYSLHENRASFDELVHAFITSHPSFKDENVRFLYEIDRILKPYVYSSTPVQLSSMFFEFVQAVPSGAHTYEITFPERFHELFLKAVPSAGGKAGGADCGYRVDHMRFQYPYMKSHGLEHNAGYCHGMMIRIDSIVPTCEVLAQASMASA